MGKSVSYQKHLLKDLKNPKLAASYLNAAVEAGDTEAFLLALRNVLDAYGTVTKAAKRTKIKRVSLHKMLSKSGNPRADNLIALFNYLGVKFKIEQQRAEKKAA